MTPRERIALRSGCDRWRVVQADTLTLLPTLPDASIDAVVTDPPYGISFHGEYWDGRDIHQTALASGRERRLSNGQAFAHWTNVWATELHRILKPGGHVLAFAAPRMSHRLTSGLEDAGLEIRDVLMWLHGQGMPKSRRLPGGLGTALKPAYEPIILARRPFAAPAVDNVRRHGTGALNIDACRIPPLANHEGAASRARGEKCVSRGEGRWPSNVVLAHAPGCRTGWCAAACPVRGLDGQTMARGPERASRFVYCAKASRRERDAGCQHLPARDLDLFPNARRDPHVPRRRVRNAHPTVKPIELMRWLIRLAAPQDGLVLDPFCGSGTTGIAAVLEHRRFLGIELDPNHANVARARITHWSQTTEKARNPVPFEQLT
jgi:DNA modification methylase